MIDDFRDFLRELVAANVQFLVVGAHALSVHGVARATGALDVWIHREVPILGRRALVINKRASGRTKDSADLEALGEA